MSGTNVWQRLLQSPRYEPVPRFVDSNQRVWRLPYHMHLFHTVREISAYAEKGSLREEESALRDQVTNELGMAVAPPIEVAEPKTLGQMVNEGLPVFVALHGGIGEDGTLQEMLEGAGTRFTGSGSTASRICIDKWETGLRIENAAIPGVSSLQKYLLPACGYRPAGASEAPGIWKSVVDALGVTDNEVIVKPRADGCSAGVARLRNAADLGVYIDALLAGRDRLDPGALSAENRIIELPRNSRVDLLFERFLRTMKFRFDGGRLEWDSAQNWVEITNGMICVGGLLTALPPSITVAQETVLSLEEKFQGGTGVNITPPPFEIVGEAVQSALKQKVLRIGELLGLRGFARMDLFVNRVSGEVIVIEVNTIPALTPSTVFFQQAMAGEPPLTPREALEAICECGGF
jgi:D-alanine-D-alanine ligase-like ATP-grasp enzyme